MVRIAAVVALLTTGLFETGASCSYPDDLWLTGATLIDGSGAAPVSGVKALGIVIAASTDGSHGDGDDTARVRVAHDLEELVGCGFTPLEAITAATRDGARVLGIDARTGTVAVGLEADLLVVDRNPLVDPTTLFEPMLVVTDGRIALNRLRIRVDPAREIALPKMDRLPRMVLTEAQARRLMVAPVPGSLVGLRDRAILETLYGTAIRAGEC